MEDLIEKARRIPPRYVRPVNEQRLTLALAVLSGEISTRQAARAMGIGETNVGARLWSHIWRAARRGELVIERKQPAIPMRSYR